MNLPWLRSPLFDLAGRHISVLGIAAFVGLMALGIIFAKFLQSGVVRRFLSRFKLDANFVAIVTTILSVAALVFFTVSAINALGIPLAWSAPLPGGADQSAPDFPAGRPSPPRLLDFVADEALSL